MTILYFTGTGNSLAVAKRIGGTLISIPQAIKNQEYEYTDDAIGIIFPTYCMYPPKIVRKFLGKSRLKADYFFAVATYGNRLGKGGDGSEMKEFDMIAEKCGYKFQYLNSILMVDNFIDVFDIEKEIRNIPDKKIEEHLNKIIEDISEKKNYHKDPGYLGSMISNICRGLVRTQDRGLAAKKFLIHDSCVGCGVCTRLCPTGNIQLNSGRPHFGTNCQSCYACINLCPQQAIYKKNEKSSSRWMNPEVTREDIIRANCQL